jgi:hypothetical protein
MSHGWISPDEWAIYVGLFVLALLALGGVIAAVVGGRR